MRFLSSFSKLFAVAAILLSQCAPAPLLAGPPGPITIDRDGNILNAAGGIRIPNAQSWEWLSGSALTIDSGAAANFNGTTNFSGHAFSLSGNFTKSGSGALTLSVAATTSLTLSSGTNTFTLSNGTAGITIPAGLSGSLTSLAYKATDGNAGHLLDGTGNWTGAADNAVWLYCAFADDPEQLFFAASYDLDQWVPLGKYTADGTYAAQGARDPQHVFYRGRWYCAYTESHVATGTGSRFGIAVSDDLIHWSRLADIDVSGSITTNPQRIWTPVLVLDANGLPYILVSAIDDGTVLFLRPTDYNDLTTFAVTQTVTQSGGPGPWLPAFGLVKDGTYYIQGPDGAAGQGVYTASVPQGPYTYAGAITGVTNESVGLTYDPSTATWYSFDDTDQTYPDSVGTPQYRTNTAATGAFSNLTFSAVRRFEDSVGIGNGNPRVIRYTGLAALSIRAAMEQVMAQAPFSGGYPLPTSATSYSFHNSANAQLNGGVPWCESGTTNGATSVITLSSNVSGEGSAGGTGFLAWPHTQPVDIRVNMRLLAVDASSPIRILLGVPKDHEGTLDHAGIGLAFYASGGNTVVKYINHDGTTLTESTAASFPQRVAVNVRIHVDRYVCYVWVNGSLVFKRFDVPVAAAGMLGDSYNSLVVQADCIGGGYCSTFVLGGSIRPYEK